MREDVGVVAASLRRLDPGVDGEGAGAGIEVGVVGDTNVGVSSVEAEGLSDLASRQRFIEHLRADGVHAVFHYVPLHDSPAGRRYGRASGSLGVTTSASERLVRLPFWIGLEEHQDYVIDSCRRALAR